MGSNPISGFFGRIVARVLKRFETLLWVGVLFVSPLLFFTDLTRNPYISQICLLNLCLVGLAAIRWLEPLLNGRAPAFPRTPVDWPIFFWCVAALLSWGVGYWGHRPFFRPSIMSEGGKNLLFLAANCLAPFYLASRPQDPEDEGMKDVSIGAWACLAVLWPLLWVAFPDLRSLPGTPENIWSHVFDPYGALLWVGGISWAFFLCRRGRTVDYVHLAMAGAFIASTYAICQYFNMEFIWPHALNPYGPRSVSTFGNPNFLSSYNVVALPFALLCFLESRGGGRLAYGALVVVLEASLISSLTRSSWGGAAMAAGILLLSPQARSKLREAPRSNGLLFGAMAVVMFFWPHNATARYSPSVFGRIAELAGIRSVPAPYAPLHQRVLIWLSAWLMGSENPVTGKGFGLFELFYPFYQGPILSALSFFRTLRTHANNAHNEIFEVFSQTGVLGLGIYLWLWTAFFASCRRHFKERVAWGTRLGAAAAAGVAGMLADNLLNVSLHFATPAFLFWWGAGLAMASGAPSGKPASSAAEPRMGLAQETAPGSGRRLRAVGWLGLAVAAMVSWYWVRVWMRETHYFAGFKLSRQGFYERAITELEESRSWGPREVNALYELGNVYARSGRYQDAVAAYSQALEANAGYDEIYYNIGAVESGHLNHPEEAIPYFLVALFINPVSPSAYNSLSNVYLKDPARYALACERLLKKAASIFPSDPNYWNNLGYLYSLARRFDAAENAYERALIINPDLAVAARNLWSLGRRSGKPVDRLLAGLTELRRLRDIATRGEAGPAAESLARKAIRDLPRFPQPRLILANILAARGEAAAAAEQARELLRLSPGNAQADYQAELLVASFEEGRGRLAEAARHYRIAFALNPASVAAQKGCWRTSQCRFVEACAHSAWPLESSQLKLPCAAGTGASSRSVAVSSPVPGTLAWALASSCISQQKARSLSVLPTGRKLACRRGWKSLRSPLCANTQ